MGWRTSNPIVKRKRLPIFVLHIYWSLEASVSIQDFIIWPSKHASVAFPCRPLEEALFEELTFHT